MISSLAIFIGTLSPYHSGAQNQSSLNDPARLLVLPDSVPVYQLERSASEFGIIKNFFFWSYKNFISSQDIQSCVFEPSCSVYAKLALEKKGVVKGSLLTFDRLSRCHAFGAKHYHFDPQKGLLIDNVE